MGEEGWVADVYRPKAHKAALLRFADAICAKRKFNYDEAGNPRLGGKFGRVYVKPSSTEPGREPIFQLYLLGGPQRIKFALGVLSFAKVTNRGDEDMLVELTLSDVTAERGAIIRDKLGLRKRFEFDEAVLVSKREMAARMTAARQKTTKADEV